MTYQIKVNGQDRTVDADGDIPLLWILRDVLGLTGTKFGCGIGQCGACTVHIDGQPARACLTAIESVGGAAITTIEAIGNTPSGRAIQKAWIDLEVPQCGYCQSGQIMSAAALLSSNANPSDGDIDAALSGNMQARSSSRPIARPVTARMARATATWAMSPGLSYRNDA